MNNEFNVLLRIHRASLTDEEKKKEIQPVYWVYPLAIEKVYARKISIVTKAYVNKIMAELETLLPVWIEENEESGNWESGYRDFKKQIEEWIEESYGTGITFDSALGKMIQDIADVMMAMSLKQWKKQTQAVLGMPYNILPPNWIDMKKNWMDENFEYIKKLATTYASQLTTILYTGLVADWLFADFQEQINLLNKRMIKTRAALLARDQTGTLVGKIIQDYARTVSNDYYLWHTAMDERVRGNPAGKYPKAIPSHYVMEGTYGRWSDSSIFSRDKIIWKPKTQIMEPFPPGFAIACRCTASMEWNLYIKEQGGEA